MSLPTYTDGETRVGHWFKDDCDTYIGRWKRDEDTIDLQTPGVSPLEMGFWGNPFPLEDYDRETSIRKFTDLFLDCLDEDHDLRAAVHDLRGDTLGCYCRRVHEDGPPCHGDVIARVADRVVVRA